MPTSRSQRPAVTTLDQALPFIVNARVVVVGDLMLDRYWTGATSRISPEAPVPVLRISGREDRLGGAANVAANVVALGGQARLVGAIGADADGRQLEALCTAAGIAPCLHTATEVPTTVKLRMLAQHQQLLRVDFEELLPAEVCSRVLELGVSAFDDVGALVLSDYAKGVLSDPQAWIHVAKARGIPVVVDPKHQDFSRYAGADILTPNLHEFQAVVGPCRTELELEARGLALCDTLGLGALLVTRGEQGMSLLRPGSVALHLPAEAREVFDVTGAGDTVCASLACALAAGLDLQMAVRLANVAAGVSVGKLGTSVVSVQELLAAAAASRSSHGRTGVLGLEAAAAAVREARARGERIVMTNGCFDLLHPGHVRYLQEAASLGDRLLVAVNTDDSVRRLKGATRPVNELSARMEVLAGLRSVDWVVPFAEDTPLALIQVIEPDVLVKGGDYALDAIVGASEVLARGGQVRALAYHDGHSSSAMLESAARLEERSP